MANQPSNAEPYIQDENPVTRDPLEQKATQQPHGQAHSPAPEAGKVAGVHHSQQGVPTSRGLGVQGGDPVDAQEAQATSRGAAGGQLQNDNVNAEEQLATLGEGEVADAADRKSGTQKAPGSGPAEEQDFASDLDRKKAEQTQEREAVKEARREGTNVGGDGRLGNESLADA